MNVPETVIRVDVLGGARLPAAYATVANGYRRSLKPKVLLPGGRLLFRPQERDGSVVFTPLTANPVGQLTAAPGQRPMELDRVRPSCGSSNATALGTRAAHLIFERLEQLRDEPGGERLDDDYTAVLLKALLVHGASWGDAADRIAAAFSNDFTRRQWRDLQRLQGRFLGYGEVTVERCLIATDQRVTVVGWGRIGAEEGHRLELPLPPSLASSTVHRRLTVTLAWLTPINPRHKDYRKGQLWFDAGRR